MKKALFLFILLLFAINSKAQEFVKTITISDSRMPISYLLAEDEIPKITHLTIEGNVTCEQLRQLSFLRNMQVLDLKDINIVNFNHKGEVVHTNVLENVSFLNRLPTSKVILPKSLQKIEVNAFRGTYKLKNVDFSNCKQLERIGEGAFSESSIQSIDLSNTKLLKIESRTFLDCNNLSSIVLPVSLGHIGSEAFSIYNRWGDTSLKREINFTDLINLKTIESGAFMHNVFKDTVLDLSNCRSLTTIESAAFAVVGNITNIKFPTVLTTLSMASLINTNLDIFDISMTQITESSGYHPFDSETIVRKAVLPKTMTSVVGAYGSALESLTCYAIEPPKVDPYYYGQLSRINKPNCVLSIPAESEAKYRTAIGWSDFFAAGSKIVLLEKENPVLEEDTIIAKEVGMTYKRSYQGVVSQTREYKGEDW